jgi:hypothetical protein
LKAGEVGQSEACDWHNLEKQRQQGLEEKDAAHLAIDGHTLLLLWQMHLAVFAPNQPIAQEHNDECDVCGCGS